VFREEQPGRTADSNAHIDGHAEPDGYQHARPSDGNGDSDPDLDRDSAADSDAIRHTDVHAYHDIDGHPYGHGDGHSDAHLWRAGTGRLRLPDADTDIHGNAYPNPDPAPMWARTRRSRPLQHADAATSSDARTRWRLKGERHGTSRGRPSPAPGHPGGQGLTI